VHGVNVIRHIEIYTAEPSVFESSSSEAETVVEKLKWYKSPDVDQILA
jgi:hypothetical protein